MTHFKAYFVRLDSIHVSVCLLKCQRSRAGNMCGRTDGRTDRLRTNQSIINRIRGNEKEKEKLKYLKKRLKKRNDYTGKKFRRGHTRICRCANIPQFRHLTPRRNLRIDSQVRTYAYAHNHMVRMCQTRRPLLDLCL